MAATHLLDTSVYCQPLKPQPLKSVRQRWEALGDERLAISVLCDAEVLFGIELNGSFKLRRSYEELLKDRFRIFPVDDSVAIYFSQIKAAARRKGAACPDVDLLIAATAKVHGLIVATLNVRDFVRLDGVAVEDWSS